MKITKINLLSVLCISLLFVVSCTGQTNTEMTSAPKTEDKSKELKETLMQPGFNAVDVKVEMIGPVSEIPTYGFYKLEFFFETPEGGINSTVQYAFSNGTVIIPGAVDIKNQTQLLAKYVDSIEHQIDFSKLTLLSGDPNSSYKIAVVDDFQCPFCKKLHEDFKEILSGKDYGLYIIHFPITSTHDKAMLYAQIFEAGAEQGEDFSDLLFTGDYDEDADEKVIEEFAKMTASPDKFKQDVVSDRIVNRVTSQKEMATKLGVSSTPTVFFKGKMIVGADIPAINEHVISVLPDK